MVRKLLKAKERPRSMMLLATLLLIFAGSLPSNARDFEYTYEGQTITYTVLDEAAKTVETKAGRFANYAGNNVSGNLILPEHPISNGVEYTLIRLGEYAFSECDLTSVVIPNSVTSIEFGAFRYCSGLTSVIIPNSVNSIGEWAFNGCSGLKKGAYPSTVSNPFGYPCAAVEYPAEGAIIEDGCVWGPDKSALYFVPLDVTEFTIPNSVTSIADNAFSGCSGLKKGAYPSTVSNPFADTCVAVEYPAQGAIIEDGCVWGPDKSALYFVPLDVTEFTIPNSVISIGYGAFYGCSGLTSVEIPTSVTAIGHDAFSGCSGLTSVVIPNSVISIGYGAFYGCSGLTSVEIPTSVTSIEKYTFMNCSGLTSVIIPNSVTSIGNNAFTDCSGLKKSAYPSTLNDPFYDGNPFHYYGIKIKYPAEGAIIEDGCVWGPDKSALYFVPLDVTEFTIPNSVTSIGESAFRDCSGLTSVVIPNSVNSIGNETFRNCFDLTAVVIPNSVNSIGDGAFYGCSGLTSVEIPNSVTSIGHDVFSGCSGLTSVVIPNSVISIGYGAFYGCSGLTSVEIPNSVTSIEKYTFMGCSGLTSVIIPNSVNSIGEWAFKGCSGLKKSAYPSTLNKPFSTGTIIQYPAEGAIIEDGCVWGPDKSALYFVPLDVTEFTIPNSVKSIGENAFKECSGLSALESLAMNPPAFSSAFDSETYNNTQLTVPQGTLFSYCNTDWVKFVKMHAEGTEENIEKYDDDVFSYICSPTTKEAMLVKGNYSSLANVSIPNRIAIENGDDTQFYQVVEIGKDAFKECSKITSLKLSKNLLKIGEYAFYGCNGLTSVDLPDGLTTIGDYAFKECKKLATIEIPNSVTSIGNETFRDCFDLTAVVIPNSVSSIGTGAFRGCKSLTSVEIPNSVTSIEEAMFYDCWSLNSVMIPNTVSSLGNEAFRYCKSLASIDIPNCVTYIGDNAFSNCDKLTSFNLADGEEMLTLGNSVVGAGSSGYVETMHIGRNWENSSAFSDNINLKNVEIGNTVTEVPSETFKGCGNLATLSLGSTLESIGASAFSGCALTDVVVPPSVTSVGDNAFASNKIKTLAIGYGISEIGEKAFDQNNDIEKVSVTAVTPPNASNNTFSRYEMPLWLINQEAFDNYMDYPRCWYRFEDNMYTLVPINSLSAEKIEVSGFPGETIKLDVKIEPEDASLQQLFWRSTRPDLISVDNEGNVTFMGEASSLTRSEEECQIIVTTMYESTPALTFDFKVTASGIEQIFGDEEFDSVKADRPNDIYTLQGVCVKRNASQEDIDALAPGLYIIAGKKVLVK